MSIVLGILLAGSLYGNYYFYTKLKAAASAIAALTALTAVATPAKAV